MNNTHGRIQILALLGFVFSTVLYSAPAAAQEPFVITAPPAGSIVQAGQPVTIRWTGGDPSWLVDVSLIELTPGFPFAAVAAPASLVPNSGVVADWPFPSNIGYGSLRYDTCGHTYQFYVQEVDQITWTYGPHFTVACAIPVDIDIKPGSTPNSINPKSRGRIPVAILSSAEFDATTQIVQNSLTFGSTGSEMSLTSCHPEDVNGDWLNDLVCHFFTQQTGFMSGDTAGELNGLTPDGTPITGTDSVRIVR